MRSFAAQYPDDVAGLVLVDSTAPTPTGSATMSTGSYDALGRVSAAVSTAARLGLGRVVAEFSYATLPTESRNVARAKMATAGHVGSAVDEYVAANTSMDQAQSLVDFAAKPLIVLTAGRGNDQDGSPSRTTWPRCPPTASTASSPGPPTPPWWTTSRTPPPSPKPSTRSSPQYVPTHR